MGGRARVISRPFAVEKEFDKFVDFGVNATDRSPGLSFSLTPHYPRNYPETGLYQPTGAGGRAQPGSLGL
ncbi:hypothetical protein EIP91_007903 [Steccherinum ochraceum]|uniref:Uncharacterized protein n=1 Tax=Steccherinum ochraceum TaxID=92696 RepID=A0A4V2MXA2_9APHY|nr:hypothetical protein EIP91_007903 [Steccherinum ochraceum]